MTVGKVVIQHEKELLFACLLIHNTQGHISADRVFRKVYKQLASAYAELFKSAVVDLKMLKGIVQHLLVEVIKLCRSIHCCKVVHIINAVVSRFIGLAVNLKGGHAQINVLYQRERLVLAKMALRTVKTPYVRVLIIVIGKLLTAERAELTLTYLVWLIGSTAVTLNAEIVDVLIVRVCLSESCNIRVIGIEDYIALKRFKDDVKEVGRDFECGISIVNYNDIREGDVLETYTEVEVKAKL